MADEISFRHIIPIQIRFSDVDQFGHMNNSVYFSLYDLAKTSYFRDVFGEHDWRKFAVVVANINADFLAPVFFFGRPGDRDNGGASGQQEFYTPAAGGGSS